MYHYYDIQYIDYCPKQISPKHIISPAALIAENGIYFMEDFLFEVETHS
jgi:hypothetical protein